MLAAQSTPWLSELGCCACRQVVIEAAPVPQFIRMHPRHGFKALAMWRKQGSKNHERRLICGISAIRLHLRYIEMGRF